MNRRSFLFKQEPLWQEHIRGRQHDYSVAAQSWLYEPGSLTQRLREAYNGEVGVKVLFQKWMKPFLNETKQLKTAPHQYQLIREVLLHNKGKPLLLARTIIPGLTIKVAHRNLAHLGNRPLGEVIFSYPDLERLSMDIAQVSCERWTESALQSAEISQPVWGRRTVYAIQQRPLLVSEFFLDKILAH